MSIAASTSTVVEWNPTLERDCPDYPSREPFGLTLVCLAYSIGCNPSPPPIDTFKVVGTQPAQAVELLTPLVKALQPAAP